MQSSNSKKGQIQKKVGDNIKSIRLKKGIQQRDLAAWCDFEYSNMCRIESGRTNITIYNLCKIADALGVDIKDLLVDIPNTNDNSINSK